MKTKLALMACTVLAMTACTPKENTTTVDTTRTTDTTTTVNGTGTTSTAPEVSGAASGSAMGSTASDQAVAPAAPVVTGDSASGATTEATATGTAATTASGRTDTAPSDKSTMGTKDRNDVANAPSVPGTAQNLGDAPAKIDKKAKAPKKAKEHKASHGTPGAAYHAKPHPHHDAVSMGPKHAVTPGGHDAQLHHRDVVVAPVPAPRPPAPPLAPAPPPPPLARDTVSGTTVADARPVHDRKLGSNDKGMDRQLESVNPDYGSESLMSMSPDEVLVGAPVRDLSDDLRHN